MRLPDWMRGVFGERAAVAATTPAPPAAVGRPDMAEYGATGTPIFGGFLRDAGEYNPQLEGLSAFRIYEQMRRSNGQVAATLMGMKLPIRSAEWTVAAPENASPIETEAADFVRECLFEDLDFDALIDNALLMLDFGCSAHEDVWYVDGNRIRLKKCAARPPATFYRWLLAEGSEDLVGIEQQAYRGGAFVTTAIPAEKLALFTFQQEGANFAGRSVLRAMYQHWYIVSNLYKVDAIACERNGMGIPVITMGPEPKSEDRRTAHEWLQKLSVHEKVSLLLPPEWKFELQGVAGAVRDPHASIAHHNMSISMAGLAQFMMLGQSESGNRALGETMADFFYLGLQATANRIARVLNLTTVKRLIDFNFGKLDRYPKVAVLEMRSLSFDALVSALKQLADAGAVTPDEGLEAWMRKRIGAPEKVINRDTTEGAGDDSSGSNDASSDDAAGARLPHNQKQEGAAGSGAVGGMGAVPEPKNDITPKVKSQAAKVAAGEAAVAVQPGEGAGSPSPVKLRREPKGIEKCLALDEMVGVLDRGRDEIAAMLRRARPAIEAEAVQRLFAIPIRNMHRVSVDADERMVAAVASVLEGVADAGFDQVDAERLRQKAGGEPEDAAAVRMAESPAKARAASRAARRAALKAAGREPLGVYADAMVSEFVNGLVSRAANVALDWRRRPAGMVVGELLQRVAADLAEQSDKWIDSVAAKAVNEAFADGRAEAAIEYSDEIQQVIYSALLDINTCGNCAAADGASGATAEDIPAVPNPDCDGGDKCRCVHVFVFADEGKASGGKGGA